MLLGPAIPLDQVLVLVIAPAPLDDILDLPRAIIEPANRAAPVVCGPAGGDFGLTQAVGSKLLVVLHRPTLEVHVVDELARVAPTREDLGRVPHLVVQRAPVDVGADIVNRLLWEPTKPLGADELVVPRVPAHVVGDVDVAAEARSHGDDAAGIPDVVPQ